MAQFNQYAVYYVNKHRDDDVRDLKEIALSGSRKSDVRCYVVDANNANDARAYAFRMLVQDLATDTGRRENQGMFGTDFRFACVEKRHASSGTISKEQQGQIKNELTAAKTHRAKRRAAKRHTIAGKPVNTTVRTSSLAVA